MLVTVISDNRSHTIEYNTPVLLKNALRDAGVAFSSPCGGMGICGGCRVRAEGNLSDPVDRERLLESGIRLACATYALGDATIYADTLIKHASSEETPICTDPFSGSKKCIAGAFDIGTTAVAAAFYSLPDGKKIFEACIANPQSAFGADVITRMGKSDAEREKMRILLEHTISEIKKSFGADTEFDIVTGNTVMLHILSGSNTDGLCTYPFTPETLFGFWTDSRYYMPCADAFIGSDAICSLIASGAGDGTHIVCDIGTNTEIILARHGRLYACSSPAGPAFEGGCISCGMTAVSGAICSVDGDKKCITVGGEKARGFCGSGLIDAVAYLIKNGYLARTGEPIATLPDFDGIRLLNSDIESVQLAKSAVRTGIELLMNEADCRESDIECLYLSGSFGAFLNAESAKSIGMIPNVPTKAIGNAALSGAVMALLDSSVTERAKSAAGAVKCIEIADSTAFENAFINNLPFQEGI